MRTFAKKPKATQQTISAKSTIPSRAHFGQSRELNSILHLQRTIGNQAVQRMSQTNAEELKEGLASTASPCFAHDFSQIPLHPKLPANAQTKLTVNPPGDIYEQEADRISEEIMHMPECGGGCPKYQPGQPSREPESVQTKGQSMGTKVIQRAPDKNRHLPTALSLNPESELPGYQSTLNADAQTALDDKRKKDEELAREIQNARALFRAHHSGHDEDVLDNIDAALDRVTEGNPDLLLAFYRYYYRHGFSDNLDSKDADKTGGTDSGDTIINPRVLKLNSGFPTDSALRLLGGTLIHEFAHTPQESNTINVPQEAFAYGVEYVLSERMGDERRMETIAKRYDRSRMDPYDQLGNGIQIHQKTIDTMHTLYRVIDAGGEDAEEARRMSVLFISRTVDPEKYPPELKAFLSKVSP